MAEVAAWLTKNQLKRNRKKSEAIVFFPAKQRDSLPADVYITVAGHRIQPSSCVRKLGVLFDSNLKMEHQIANTVKSCYYQITNIKQIRPHLTEESSETHVHTLVTSRLDYGNALFVVSDRWRCSVYKRYRTVLLASLAVQGNTNTLHPCCSVYSGCPFICDRLTVLLFTYCAINGLALPS